VGGERAGGERAGGREGGGRAGGWEGGRAGGRQGGRAYPRLGDHPKFYVISIRGSKPIFAKKYFTGFSSSVKFFIVHNNVT
jgi:hypothetical protein